MSTYEFAIRHRSAPALSDSLAQLSTGFWKWWLGLYAAAPDPRRLQQPMI